MNDSRYKAFITAAELGSLTKAAERLGYTQSGMTHLIDALEKELGFRVLLRDRKKTELTPEGGMLLPYARAMLQAADTLQMVCADISGLRRGNLTIGTFSSVAVQWLPRLLSLFVGMYPGIHVTIRNGTYADVENDLRRRRTDCAFVTLPRTEFNTRFLAEDPIMAILPRNHRLAECSSVNAFDLTGERFIIPAEGAGYDLGSLFRKMPARPEIAFDVNDDFAAVGMVRNGLGITVLPGLLIEDMPLERIAAVPIQGFRRQIGIAACSDMLSPAVRAFMNICTEYVPELAGLRHGKDKGNY